MKTLQKILLTFTLVIPFLAPIVVSAANPIIILENGNSGNNLNIGSYKNGRALNNDKLDLFWDGFIQASSGWEKSIYYTLVRIARDLKNFFFIASTIYFMIIVLKVLMTDHTSEEVEHFKKWILWITIWLIVMQIAYSFVKLGYDRWVWETVAFSIVDGIINPLIRLLELLTSIFFLGMMFYAFYRMVTSNGAEDKIKTAKMTIIYAIVGFIVVRFAKALVEAVYGTAKCTQVIGGIIQINDGNCINPARIEWSVWIVINIINWLNSFVWIVVVIMILYAGFIVFTSAGDEEKLKKAKRIILYVAIWMFVLVVNWLLLTFFILPTTKI
jgi:Type IV secretion system pilin